VALGGLRSAIFNEVLQFVLIWLGALLIPILGLIESGGWSICSSDRAESRQRDYTHLWSTLGRSRQPDGSTGRASCWDWLGILFGYWTTISWSCSASSPQGPARGELAPIMGRLQMMVPFM